MITPGETKLSAFLSLTRSASASHASFEREFFKASLELSFERIGRIAHYWSQTEVNMHMFYKVVIESMENYAYSNNSCITGKVMFLAFIGYFDH